jgi:hypothetical protein
LTDSTRTHHTNVLMKRDFIFRDVEKLERWMIAHLDERQLSFFAKSRYSTLEDLRYYISVYLHYYYSVV